MVSLCILLLVPIHIFTSMHVHKISLGVLTAIDSLAGIEPVQTLNILRHYQQRKLKATNW